MRVTIKQAIEAADYELAVQILDDAFLHNPDDDAAVFYFAACLLHTAHPGPAKYMLEKLTRDNPDKWQSWLNLGLAYDQLDRHDTAIEKLEKAFELCPDDLRQQVLVNLSSISTRAQRWDDARKWSDMALAIDDSLQVSINQGFAWLHQHEFAKGWDAYAKGVGHQIWRDRRSYRSRPHYDGEPDARVVIYGEQGIGDQIAFMSALPDALDAGLQVAAISCYPKMQQLFQDTFPDIPVHGSQFDEDPTWAQGLDFDAMLPMSWLMKYYRREAGDYSGAPYLQTNPAKQLQWKALLDSVSDRPKVGICWTGGKRGAHSWRNKSMAIAELEEVLKVEGVDWVCLEYQDRSEEIAWMHRENGLLIREWPWATRTEDYSDTAALVANLDALVTVPTSVNHLAGGLGVSTHCLVNTDCHFHYSAGMLYYDSVHLYRRDQVAGVIDAISDLAPRIQVA